MPSSACKIDDSVSSFSESPSGHVQVAFAAAWIRTYVDILVADYVLGNHGATNRRTAIATIDVDSHTARGGGVESVGKVSGNRIADDLVPTHVICREPKRGSHVRVQREASQSVMCERVPDDHVV